jgi:hypothetical protein
VWVVSLTDSIRRGVEGCHRIQEFLREFSFLVLFASLDGLY